jgi:hypothetical protein
MANIASRGTRMDKSIVFRATEQDKAELRIAATNAGMTVCSLIRQLLIKEKLISATNAPDDVEL